jgi:predicted phosphoribosyltransferase
MKLFRDRREAGRRLARVLSGYACRNDLLVVALPRGGVPVAFEIAAALDAPLDVFVVRKLGVPGDEEFAFGALASGGLRLIDERVVRQLGISERAIEQISAAAAAEVARRERAYRGGLAPLSPAGKLVILVDDGLATGATMQAAIAALSRRGTRRIVLAVPVAQASVCETLRRQVEEAYFLHTPESLGAIGLAYEDFRQLDDAQVSELLVAARTRSEDAPAACV